MNLSFPLLIGKLLQSLPPRLQGWLMTLRSFNNRMVLGRGAYIHRSVQIIGKSYVRIGVNSVLSQDCWLNVNHRKGNVPAIAIGDHCFIGRRNFFSSGRRIELGHYVLTANDCYFLGSSHVINNPMQPYLSAGTTDTYTIQVGHNTFFGAGVRVLGNVSIGHGCVIGACSVVTRDIPPFSQVFGFPASIHRRYSVPRQAWVLLAEFTAEDERALPPVNIYLEQLRKYPLNRMPYLAAGSDMGQR